MGVHARYVGMTQANGCGGFECKSSVEPSGAVHCIGDWTPCVQRTLWGKEIGLIDIGKDLV